LSSAAASSQCWLKVTTTAAAVHSRATITVTVWQSQAPGAAAEQAQPAAREFPKIALIFDSTRALRAVTTPTLTVKCQSQPSDGGAEAP
jgi:hypothetical protein